MKKIISLTVVFCCLFTLLSGVANAETLRNNTRLKTNRPCDTSIGTKNQVGDEIVYDSFTVTTKKDYLYYFWFDQSSGLMDVPIALCFSRGDYSEADFVEDYLYSSEPYKFDDKHSYDSLVSVYSVEDGDLTFIIEPFEYKSCDYSVLVQGYPMGDVDLDGAVTAADARLALRAAVGLEEFAAAEEWTDLIQCCQGDVDNDGEITAGDARTILRAAVGLEHISLL